MTSKTFVLGLGNVLCGDDGFGVHACHMLLQGFSFPDDCSIVDGGTQGQLLYGIVEEAARLLILDAANLGERPGELGIIRNEQIPAWLGSCKLSAHQTSFAEIMALAKLKNILPPEIILIGFQPVRLEFGAAISRQARACLPEAVKSALQILAAWGIEPKRASCRLECPVFDAARSFLGPLT